MNKAAALKATEETLDIIEPVIDEIEETIATVERIPRLRLNGTTRKQQLIILGVTALTSAAVGGAVVGMIVKKRMTLKIDELVAHEVAETRAFYQRLNKPPLEQLAEQHLPADRTSLITAVEAIERYAGTPDPEQESVVTETVTHNIFVEGKPMDVDFDYEAEVAQRTEDRPYVISYDEFQQGEKDYVQNTLTWYEGDDTLADDKNQPIPDTDMVVGDENLHRFGHGSKDPRIVYVRNDVMEVDFEVVRHTSGFAQTVLGFQHSDRPGSRKERRFRGDDG